jgi:ketosteroid isomerase-like protein
VKWLTALNITRLGGSRVQASQSDVTRIATCCNNTPGSPWDKQEQVMTSAHDLLKRHIETLVDNPAKWRNLVADDIVWELAYAPSLGHPARLSGKDAVIGHAAWFVGAVEAFRFFDVRIHPFEDGDGAVAELKGEGIIKSTGRVYRQEYVVFLRAVSGKISFLREYFDPVRAAKALDVPIATGS